MVEPNAIRAPSLIST